MVPIVYVYKTYMGSMSIIFSAYMHIFINIETSQSGLSRLKSRIKNTKSELKAPDFIRSINSVFASIHITVHPVV